MQKMLLFSASIQSSNEKNTIRLSDKKSEMDKVNFNVNFYSITFAVKTSVFT